MIKDLGIGDEEIVGLRIMIYGGDEGSGWGGLAFFIVDFYEASLRRVELLLELLDVRIVVDDLKSVDKRKLDDWLDRLRHRSDYRKLYLIII